MVALRLYFLNLNHAIVFKILPIKQYKQASLLEIIH